MSKKENEKYGKNVYDRTIDLDKAFEKILERIDAAADKLKKNTEANSNNVFKCDTCDTKINNK